uniref:hypothetical protein n=1 Tax=Vibrio vulnificus TaxID=672 RepID=UPI00057C815D
FNGRHTIADRTFLRRTTNNRCGVLGNGNFLREKTQQRFLLLINNAMQVWGSRMVEGEGVK